MKLWAKNTLLSALLVLIIAVPLMFMGGHEFGGSDGQASETVSEIESLLFCVQAAIGAGIVGFALGRITKKNVDR